MRIYSPIKGHSHPSHGANQAGMAVIVVMILISIILIFMAGNVRTIRNLDRDVKLIERAQTLRLQSPAAPTNTASVANGINTQSAAR
jgi:hypothetical protein